MRSRHFLSTLIVGCCLAVNFFSPSAIAQTAAAGGQTSTGQPGPTGKKAANTASQTGSAGGQTSSGQTSSPGGQAAGTSGPASAAGEQTTNTSDQAADKNGPKTAGAAAQALTGPDLTPKTLTFGDLPLGGISDAKSVTITNTSGAKTKLKVSAPNPADYVIDNHECPEEIDAGKSCVVSIRFKPQAAGDRKAVLQVSYEGDDKRPGSTLTLEGASFLPLGGICSFTHGQEILLIVITVFVYWLFVVVVRWHRIASPTREFLRGGVAIVRAELDLLPELPPDPDAPAPPPNWREIIARVIEAAGLEVSPEIAHKGRIHRLCNFLFWSRGQEITGWGFVHDAQVKMAAHQPPATVIVRLESAAQQLKATGDPPCQSLGQTIEAALAPDKNTSRARLRELLALALQALNDREDNGFASLVSWQNKASWLVGCGLFIILVLTIAIPHHAILFVVGAAGGLISRMTRSLNRKDVPTDYGASWTTLFLSPVSGALGAWAGILVANLAVRLEVLGPVFRTEFSDICNPNTLAIAFVFGFSERLLDNVLDKLEDAATSTAKSSPPPAAPKPPAPAAPPAAPAGGLKVTTDNLPSGKVGQDYDQKLQASGAVGEVAWSIKGDLPPGLSLSDAKTGAITGKPTHDGTFKFTVSVKDANSTQEKEFTIVVTL